MLKLPNNDKNKYIYTIEQTKYTIKNISELYNSHYDINSYYHFRYKTEESLAYFGDFSKSILDKSTHHTIYPLCKCISHNDCCLVLQPANKYNYKHTIAFDRLDNNYIYDIITSSIDGKILVIYEKYNKNI